MNRSGAILRYLSFAVFSQLIGPLAIQGATGIPNIAVDASGKLYVASTSPTAHLLVTAIDGTGAATPLLDLGIGSRLEAITVDSLGFLYVAYTKSTGAVVVDRYDSSGAQKYSVDLGGTNRLEGILTDSGGNLYIAWTDSIAEVVLDKY